MKTTQINFSKLISTVKYVGFAAMFVAGLATFSGCATKGCTDETADNYDAAATEDDGTCIPARDKFLGTYSMSGTVSCGVSGNGTINPTATTVSTSSSGPTKISIALSSLVLTATVDGNGLVFDNQSVGGYDYTGTGTLTNNTLSLTLNEFDVTVPETCVYTISGTK